MPWARIDDRANSDAKLLALSDSAYRLWVAGLIFCNFNLTDGFIPSEALQYLGVKSAQHLVKHLVSAGLWDEVEGGWEVHDYLNHNKSASEVRRTQAERAEGGNRGGRPKTLEVNLKGSGDQNLQGKPSSKPSLSVDVSAAGSVALEFP